MLSPQALFKALVSRVLPPPVLDGPEAEAAVRASRFRELIVGPVFPGKQILGDEGSYFVANQASPGGGGVLGTPITYGLPAVAAVIGNAAAILAFYNSDPGLSSGGSGKSILLDYIKIFTVEATAPASGTDVRWAFVVDTAMRTPSANAGGPITPVNVNLASVIASVTRLYFCNAASGLTLAASGPTVRTVGHGFFKHANTVTGDIYELQFGAADSPNFQQVATAMKYLDHCAPVPIPPQSWGILYLAVPAGATNNMTYEFEVGLIER